MYSKRNAERFCCEDPSKIENYEKAVADKKHIWVLHHRLEIILNVSRQWLKDHNLYYNRPAEELIFLTISEHTALHGCNRSTKTREKLSKSQSSDKNNMYGKTRENHPNYKKLCPLVLYTLRSVLGLQQEAIALKLGVHRKKVRAEIKYYGIEKKKN